MKKILSLLIIAIIFFPLARAVSQYRELCFSPFDLELMRESYGRSQYVRKDPAGWLPDEFLYAYAGWYYVNGGSPIIVNPENPPLGKYIVGISISLFNHDKIPGFIFGFLSLFSLFLLCRLFLKENWLALLPLAIFAWGKLFQEQLIHLPLFETFALTFLNLAFYFFLRGLEKDAYFWLSSFFLGALWATKPWMLTIPLMAAWPIYLLLVERKFIKLAHWLISLPMAVVVLLWSYLRLAVEGWGPYKILSVQKWIFWYHRSKLIKFGSVWPFIYLRRWHVWWGDQPIMPVSQWNIFWPIFITLALIFSILVLAKTFGLKKKWLAKFKFDKKITVLCLWVVFYLTFLSFGDITSRYLFYLLPYCYLLGVYFLIGLWQTKFLSK